MADNRIEPLEVVTPTSPVTQRRRASAKQILIRGRVGLLGRDAFFHGLLLLTFALLATWGILHHAMWRDELEPWLVAADSRSLVGLLHNLRPQGHPFLWYLLLYCLSRFTVNPMAMQFLHLGLAVATIWVFLRFSPFRRIEKAFFIFGYFPLYEYCAISRNYVLIPLLVFLFCAFLQSRPGRYIPLAVILFCLANSHLYGFVVALAFLVFLIGERVFCGQPENQIAPQRRRLAAAVSIMVLGFALAVWQILSVTGRMADWRHPLTISGLAQSAIMIWRGYVPLPVRFPYWPQWSWGTNFLCDGIALPVFVPGLLSVGLWIGSAGLLLDRPKGIFLYGLITIGLLMFQFIVAGSALRQAGILFIGLIAVFWLSAGTFEGRMYSGLWGNICEKIPNWRRTFLMVLLVIHLAAGLYVYSAALTYPFSASRDAAQFIRRQGLAQAPIVASRELNTQGLAAYLERPVYYADISQLGSHPVFFGQVQGASAAEILASAYHLFENKKEDVVLALSFPLSVMVNGTSVPLSDAYCGANGVILAPSEWHLVPGVKIKMLAQFGCVTDESYFIYRLGLER